MVLKEQLCLEKDLVDLTIQTIGHKRTQAFLCASFRVDLFLFLLFVVQIFLDLIELADKLLLKLQESPNLLLHGTLLVFRSDSLFHLMETVVVGL